VSGRARWKIENETFNVLKTGDHRLEHNFATARKTPASVLVALNLLAFAFHVGSMLAMLAWKHAMDARGAAYQFFEHLRTIVVYVVLESWDHLLRSIAGGGGLPLALTAPSATHRHRITEGRRTPHEKTLGSAIWNCWSSGLSTAFSHRFVRIRFMLRSKCEWQDDIGVLSGLLKSQLYNLIDETG
jgi:hypothetical protein